MKKSYRANIRGDRIEWMNEAPKSNVIAGVEVIVDEPTEDDAEIRRRRLRDVLRDLAASDPFAEIEDPVAWQRAVRKDRALPRR